MVNSVRSKVSYSWLTVGEQRAVGLRLGGRAQQIALEDDLCQEHGAAEADDSDHVASRVTCRRNSVSLYVTNANTALLYRQNLDNVCELDSKNVWFI